MTQVVGLIATLIGVVIVTGASLVGTKLNAIFTYVSTKLVVLS